MPEHSYLLYDPKDTETTKLTHIAHAAGRAALSQMALAQPVQIALAFESQQPYVLEVHGQSSVTGHGKQGLRPRRLALLRILQGQGIPVLLVFTEGKAKHRIAWLHDLPKAQPISFGDDADREGTMRYGWHVSEFLTHLAEALPVIGTVPEPRERAQEELIG